MSLMFKGVGLSLGKKKKASTPKRIEKKTILGALNLNTQRFYWKQAEKGNSEVFIEFLYQLKKPLGISC